MLKDFKFLILLLIGLLLIGTIGYMLIEGWSFLDSIYMTIVTLSTTGFKEVFPLSDLGRIHTMILIILGISFIFYALGNITQEILETDYFRKRSMKLKLLKLKDHYVICGFGRIGRRIAFELDKSKKNFVVIESNEKNIEDLEEQKFTYVIGDATEENVLIDSGIERAKAMAAVLSTDLANVYNVLSAKGLNSSLYVVARVVDQNAGKKLLKAGADKIIWPYAIGGQRMANSLMYPNALNVLDNIMFGEFSEFITEEIIIADDSELVGKEMTHEKIQALNIIVIAAIQLEKGFIYNPGKDFIFSAGDRLIVIGKKASIAKLNKLNNSHTVIPI